MTSSPNAVARELREFCRKPSLQPLALVQQHIEQWRQDFALEPRAYVNIGNNQGKTPLHFAAQLRDDGMTEYLLSLSADPNATTVRGHTPLIFASGRGRSETVVNLLAAGAKSRVRIVNGDTALSMGTTHALDEVALEALRNAESSEVDPWLDFMQDECAIEAQADHILSKPQMAQWASDAPPLVAALLERRAAAESNALASTSSGAAFAEVLQPLWDRELEFADALLIEACRPSGKKRAQCTLRDALLAVANALSEAELHSFLIVLLHVVSKGLPEVSRRLAAGDHGPKQAKYGKNLATSVLMSVLKELGPLSHGVTVETMGAETSPWIAVELLTPPIGVNLIAEAVHLEAILKRLCRADSWGSDFGTALRWLRLLRPKEEAAIEEAQAFGVLATAFIDGAIAACEAGQSLKCHSRRDSSSALDEVEEVLRGVNLDSLHQALGANHCSKTPQHSICAHMIDGIKSVPSVGPPFLELQPNAKVVWVSDAASWAHAESIINSCKIAAVDTEWWGIGVGPALIQIAVNFPQSDGPTSFLIDTWHDEGSVSATEFRKVAAAGLLRLFSHRDLQIVGWSFHEDAKRLKELCGGDECLCCFPVMDLQPMATSVASTSTKHGGMEGLAITCARFLGKPLDKTEQCSDWRRRPLTDAQRCYAALDAIVLLELYSALMALRDDFVGA